MRRAALIAVAAVASATHLAGSPAVADDPTRPAPPDGQNRAKAALLAGEVDVLTMSPNWLVPDDAVPLFTDLGIEHNPDLRVLLQISWMAFDHWEPVGDPTLWNPARKIQHNEQRDSRTLDGLREASAAITAVIRKQVAEINGSRGRAVISLA